MARRVRFSIAQPITIAGFLTGSVLLICDMAAFTASSTYHITDPKAEPSARHALTGAFYYAIWAAAIYMIIGLLMSFTVYGANKGYYKKDFQLTASQRTLMLQTMSFITYLLLGALVFCKIEGWEYLDAVYWADVTLLTVGIGDYTPATNVGKGLLFPFAIGGILIVGLVVGSIRTLVLERGKEKIAARITEKRRSTAVNHVDVRHQTIKISHFAKADFSTDPSMPLAERRREEFHVMRKVQDAAERERRYMALTMSGGFALALWFAGAAIFMRCEYNQQWSYFTALYFSYTSLLTIGYGDLQPLSNSGKPFFVLWSLLAVPSLTILISNMGDTIVKWVSDFTIWVGAVTVLPGEQGIRATAKQMLGSLKPSASFVPPGIFGDIPHSGQENDDRKMHETNFEARMLDRLADRLSSHLEAEELQEAEAAHQQGDDLERDIHFYHYVLSRECRNVQKDLSASPPKKYEWGDWEYFLKLMGNEDDPVDFPGQEQPDILVPDVLRISSRHNTTSSSASSPSVQPQKPNPDDPSQHRGIRRRKPRTAWSAGWSWLSNESPLMGTKTESEWILERLSAALERELNRQRKGGRRRPPVSYTELRGHVTSGSGRGSGASGSEGNGRDEEGGATSEK